MSASLPLNQRTINQTIYVSLSATVGQPVEWTFNRSGIGNISATGLYFLPPGLFFTGTKIIGTPLKAGEWLPTTKEILDSEGGRLQDGLFSNFIAREPGFNGRLVEWFVGIVIVDPPAEKTETTTDDDGNETTVVIPAPEIAPAVTSDSFRSIADMLAPRFNWDLVDGAVGIEGREIAVENLSPLLREALESQQESVAILEVKKGDKFPVDIGFQHDAFPVSAPPDTLKMAITDSQLRQALQVEVGDYTTVFREGVERYRLFVNFRAARMREILSQYVDPTGTFVDALCELEATWQAALETTEWTYETSVALEAGPDQVVEIPLGITQAEASLDYDIDVQIRPAGIPDNQTLNAPFSTQLGSYLEQGETFQASGGQMTPRSLGTDAGAPTPSKPASDYVLLPAWLSSKPSLALTENGDLTLTIDLAQFSNTGIGAFPTGQVWSARVSNVASPTPPNHFLRRSDDIASVPSGSAGATLTFKNSDGTTAGSKSVGDGAGYELGTSTTAASQTMYIFAAPDNSLNTFDLVWLSDPGYTEVNGVAILPGLLPQTSEFEVTASVTRADGGLVDAPVSRKSTHTFVVRLRGDLIRDVEPEPTS